MAENLEAAQFSAPGRDEMLVPYNLTLQWLEGHTKTWPTHERALLKVGRKLARLRIVLGWWRRAVL
jgi:hypothetical protein